MAKKQDVKKDNVAQIATEEKVFKRLNITNGTYLMMKVLEGKYKTKKVSLIDDIVNGKLQNQTDDNEIVHTGINVSPSTLTVLQERMEKEKKSFNQLITELISEQYDKLMEEK